MVVTVSNQYGTGAVAIAQRVAAELGYGFVDRELPVVVAKRLNVPVDVVEENEDSGRSIGERLLTSLEMATPELAPSTTIAQPFDETLV
ncbi:MAG: cytidylate kinase family protein, partial [Candidatus Eremiobacteraeota bacterium]|nr:cytidylate kinase family protein [Candidatus Eremiobacteraeota bacterium]